MAEARVPRIFSLLSFGVLLPAGCLWADPTSFRETYFPGYAGVVTAFLLVQVAVFAAWLGFGRRLVKGSRAVGAFLLLGSSAALFIGFILLPVSSIGAFFLIGLLGFIPFGTAWAYYRLGGNALREAGISEQTLRVLGWVLLIGSAGAAWGTHASIHRGPDVDALRKEGDPIARSIYAFRDKHGLWPTSLADVGEPSSVWTCDGPILSRSVSWNDVPIAGHAILVYSFRREDEGWRLQERESHKVLSGKIDEAPSSTARTEAHEPFVVAELQRRIQREPGEIRHHQDLVSYLRERRRLEDASSAAEACSRAFPRRWWPAVASADLARELGRPRRDDLAQWVQRHPRFTTVVYLFQYDSTAGDASAALEDIRSALQYRFESHPDDSYVESWYLYVMAIYAYERGEFALAIEVSERGATRMEASLGFIRTASRLGLGDVERARLDLEAADREKGQAGLWVGDVEALRAAVGASERSFRLVPKDRMPLRLYKSPD